MNRMNSEDIQHIGEIFLKHRGEKNALNKEQLYKLFYGKGWNPSSSHFYKQKEEWAYLRRIMKFLRKRGDHFIIYRALGIGRFHYFLLGSRNEGEQFKQFLQATINSFKETQKKCDEYMKENLTQKVKIVSRLSRRN